MRNPFTALRSSSTKDQAFEYQRAEKELWLEECFLPTQASDAIFDETSTIVFGDIGCGKSALFKMLLSTCIDENGQPLHLVVHWLPAPLKESESGDTAWVNRQADDLRKECAEAIARFIGQFPSVFQEAGWAKERLKWIIQEWLGDELQLRLEPLQDNCPPEGVLLLQSIMKEKASPLFTNFEPEKVFKETIKAVRKLGLQNILITMDGLHGWALDTTSFGPSLAAFSQSLSLFEVDGLYFKYFFPTSIEGPINRASAQRHRIKGYRLEWSEDDLLQMVELRLKMVFGDSIPSLDALCKSPGLLSWLHKVGGSSPREWLDQLAPLVRYALKHPDHRPIDAQTWYRLRSENPPRFNLDSAHKEITLGGGQLSLSTLPGKEFELLVYLYERSGQVVSKADIYYHLDRGLKSIPIIGDKEYVDPVGYTHTIEGRISKLRDAIEPDPQHHVLIQTIRSHGYRFKVRT
jgi:antitoxin component of RelBE/YafQ-DinJ toxin-antitoxin module